MNYFPEVDYGRPLQEVVKGCKNFKYFELISSETAMKLKIINKPNEEQWRNLETVCNKVLQPLRDHFGPIKINSAFRSSILNSHPSVGGSPTSNHCLGEAIDLESAVNVPLIDILEFIDTKLIYHELIAEYFPDGWVHVAYREGSDRKLLKLKDKNHNYARVTLDYVKSIYGK